MLDLDAAKDIDGFPGLEVVGGALTVRGDLLEDVGGSGAFCAVAGTALRHLSGLVSLQTLSWEYADLNIEDNAWLRDVEGLSGPLVVPDSVDIVNNAVLEAVDGLHGIASIAGCLHIEDNPNLPTAAAVALRDAIGTENVGCVQIDGNAGDPQPPSPGARP